MSMLASPPETRRLGRSDIFISPLAWGMWRLAETYRSIEDAARLVHTAVDCGITLLDTADIYGFDGLRGFGAAESLLGEVLAAEPGLRGRFVLATKGGIAPPAPYDQSAGYMRGAIEASLQRMRVEVIDLYQIHRPDILAHPQELARVLEDALASGKIRSVGVSNFSRHQTAALNHFLGGILASTQLEISPLQIEPVQDGAMDQAMMLGLTVLAWSPLAGGRLLNPVDARDVAVGMAVAGALDDFADARGISRSVAALSWLMAHPAGIVPIVGSQDVARIRQAARAGDVVWNRQDWYGILVAARGESLP
ncbi:MAG: hypothetical protein RLY97_189 [Pseudomonadota bacterium]